MLNPVEVTYSFSNETGRTGDGPTKNINKEHSSDIEIYKKYDNIPRTGNKLFIKFELFYRIPRVQISHGSEDLGRGLWPAVGCDRLTVIVREPTTKIVVS